MRVWRPVGLEWWDCSDCDDYVNLGKQDKLN